MSSIKDSDLVNLMNGIQTDFDKMDSDSGDEADVADAIDKANEVLRNPDIIT